jgi:hypothetical protein
VVEVTATRALQTFPPAIYSVTFALCVGRHVSSAADVGCDGVFIEI